MIEQNNRDIVPRESNFLLYTTPGGGVRVDVLFFNQTVWLTQKRMAELFGVCLLPASGEFVYDILPAQGAKWQSSEGAPGAFT